MIVDHEANVVYVADTLERKFSDVHSGLRTILERHGIPLRVIPGTKDIWCRDYMPIQVAEDRFVQFRYKPDYLGGRYKSLRRDGEIGPTMPFVRSCERSEIVLDGGNVVRWNDAAILTDKIYAENPRWGRKGLEEELRQVLGAHRLIVIPKEPEDVVGHSDGVVRFLDGGTVLVNAYRNVDETYRRLLHWRLSAAGMRIVELPYEPVGGAPRDIPSAVGNYLNFLHVGTVIVFPTYGKEADEKARGILRTTFLGFHLLTLESRRLAAEGGVLNCICWTVRDSGDQLAGG